MPSSVFDLFAKLSIDTTNYEKGLKDSKSLANNIGTGIKKGLGLIAKAGAAAFSAASIATTKFVKDSVQAGMDFDASMAQVAATLGKTVDEMMDETGTVELSWGKFTGNLREYAQEMGKNTAFSATQAADALNYMALAGYDAQTSMEMLPNVLNLAAAGAMDLATASDMVTDVQTAFGISLDRTSQMVDEMAKAASTGNTSVQQLGEAFLVVGGLASELNGGMVELTDGEYAAVDGTQELEIALTAMANAGIKGSEAGTHMRNMLMKLSSPTEDGALALEQMGVSIFDTEGKMRSLSDIFGDLSENLESMTQEQKIQTISELFNARDLSSAEALLNAVNQDWDAIGASILDAEGAASQMAETQLDNLAGDITLFQSALEGAQIAISDSLSPTLREFVQFGTESVSKLTTAFQEGGLEGAINALPPIVDELLAKVQDLLPKAISIVGIVAESIANNLPQIVDSILPPLLSALLSVTTALVNNIPKLIEVLINAVTQVLGGDTVDTIFAALENLLDGVFDLLNEAFTTENIQKVFNWIFNFVEHVVDLLANNLPDIIGVVTNILVALSEAFYSPDTITTVLGIATALITAIVDGLMDGDNLQRLLDALLNIILMSQTVMADPEVINALTLAASTIVFELSKGILQALPQIITSLVQFCDNIVNFILSYDFSAAGQSLISGFVDGFKAIDWSFLNEVEEKWMALWDSIAEYWKKIATKWNDFWKGIGEKLYEGIENVKRKFNEGKEKLITMLANFAVAFVSKVEGARQTVIDKFNSVVQHIKDLPNKARTWGSDMIQNFINGITSMVSRAGDAARNIAETIASYIHFSEPDVGPLSDFSTYAPDMIDTFVAGIEENKNKIATAMNDALNVSPMSSESNLTANTQAVTGSASEALMAILNQILDELQKGHQVVLSTEMVNRALGQTQAYSARGEIV